MHVHRLAGMTAVDTAPNPGATVVSPRPAGPQLITGTAWSRSTWALLVVLCGALFLDGLATLNRFYHWAARDPQEIF